LSNHYYYVSGNTAEGFINYVASNTHNINQIVALKHPSETVKTKILNQLIDSFSPVYTLEIWKSPLGSAYLDGIIIREKSIAVISDKIVHTDARNEILELDLTTILPNNDANDLEANKNFNALTEQAYHNFSIGLTIHDDLEAIYIQEMNFGLADELATNFMEQMLQNANVRSGKGHVFHRFFGTNTAEGVVNVIPHLIENISKVFFIKGRAGTGKSTFMKKIAKACEERGFEVETYHCSFDPNSLDMVLVRELDFCIFDSTDPHEFFPNRAGEVIIDLYDKAVTPGTDEKYVEQIRSITNHYKSYMKKGIQLLQQAGQYFEKIEQSFTYTDQDIDKAVHFVEEQIAP